MKFAIALAVTAGSAWITSAQIQEVFGALWTMNPWQSWGTRPAVLHKDYLKTADLERNLSPSAEIFVASNPRFNGTTFRWQNYKSPTFQIAVSAAVEEDVVHTVSLLGGNVASAAHAMNYTDEEGKIKFANENSLPFLAFTGGHGATDSLESIRDGVGISMRSLNQVTVHADGQTASIGGGATTFEVTQALWKAGKQTATGVCECTGFISPALGGGHGFLQGQYGLVTDQLASLRLVLANGTAVTASPQSNPDLFWAMQGAGHNFGVVVEATVKIYDVPFGTTKEKWTYEQFIFRDDGNTVETVFTVAAELLESQSAEYTHFVHFVKIPIIDEDKPVLLFTTVLNGPESVSSELSSPIRALGPLSSTRKVIDYPDTPKALMASSSDPVCEKHGSAASILTFPVDLYKYNVSAMRYMYDAFASALAKEPRLSGSAVMVEGFSTHGVRGVPEESTAIPFRNRRLLISPTIMFDEEGDDQLLEDALSLGREIRQTLLDGSAPEKHLAYVNYARGDEAPEAVYGHDSWRLTKLKALKQEFDPLNRFRGYAPIPLD